MTEGWSEGESSLREFGLPERGVIDALPRAVIVTDTQGRILLWNRFAAELYGWSEPEMLGRLVGEVLVPLQDQDRADEIMAAMVGANRGRVIHGHAP